MFDKIELRHGKSEVFFIATYNSQRGLLIRDNHMGKVRAALSKAGINDFTSQHLPEKALIENRKAHRFFIESHENDKGDEERFFVSCKKFDPTDIEHTCYLFDILDSVGFNRENNSYAIRKFVPQLVEMKSSTRPNNPFGVIMLVEGNSKMEKMLMAFENKSQTLIDSIDLAKIDSFLGCRVSLVVKMIDGEEKRYGNGVCLKHIDENYSRLLVACNLDRFRKEGSSLSPYF